MMSTRYTCVSSRIILARRIVHVWHDVSQIMLMAQSVTGERLVLHCLFSQALGALFG